MRDLELRGAGNILGKSNPGKWLRSDFTYCKMLKRTINALQGKIPQATVDTRIELHQDAHLPDSYIEDVNLRIDVYRRFGEAVALHEVDEIWSEIVDRFGTPPEPANWL